MKTKTILVALHFLALSIQGCGFDSTSENYPSEVRGRDESSATVIKNGTPSTLTCTSVSASLEHDGTVKDTSKDIPPISYNVTCEISLLNVDLQPLRDLLFTVKKDLRKIDGTEIEVGKTLSTKAKVTGYPDKFDATIKILSWNPQGEYRVMSCKGGNYSTTPLIRYQIDFTTTDGSVSITQEDFIYYYNNCVEP
ncbi:MAG: hypothetical protein JWQ35_1436 [Bacteriovoracaceae bacterium]|nr:hypothetical protein [Bacteriovoracaceae bacterium]